MIWGAPGNIFIDFYWFLEPQEAGTPAAGWPPDGPRMARYCLGALLGRLGGRRQLENK